MLCGLKMHVYIRPESDSINKHTWVYSWVYCQFLLLNRWVCIPGVWSDEGVEPIRAPPNLWQYLYQCLWRATRLNPSPPPHEISEPLVSSFWKVWLCPLCSLYSSLPFWSLSFVRIACVINFLLISNVYLIHILSITDQSFDVLIGSGALLL